jgi:hypothetical protein
MHVHISRVEMSENGSGAPCESSVSTIDDNLARAEPASAQPQGLSAAVSGAPERHLNVSALMARYRSVITFTR